MLQSTELPTDLPALTPGSRRKLLRHINDGADAGELATEMQISLRKLQAILRADAVLAGLARQQQLLDDNDRLVVTLAPDHRVVGLNPAFVREVWHKRRQAAVTMRVTVLAARQRNYQTPVAEAALAEPLRRILQDCALHHGVSLAAMLGRSRRQPLATARQHAMWRICRERGLSYAKTGRLFGRDASTVYQAVKKLEAATD